MHKTDRTHETSEGCTSLVNIGTSQNRYVLDKIIVFLCVCLDFNFHFPQVIGFRCGFYSIFFYYYLTRLFKG